MVKESGSNRFWIYTKIRLFEPFEVYTATIGGTKVAAKEISLPLKTKSAEIKVFGRFYCI